MSSEIDEMLEAIQRLSQQLATLPPGPARESLEAERETLRAKARLVGDTRRPPPNLQAELANIEAQLAAMDDATIKPALNESYKLITDPSAYRKRINESIEANEADHRKELIERRAELLGALDEIQDG